MKKIILSILIILSSFFAINYNCNVFAINYNCNVFANTDLNLNSYSQIKIINENNIFGIDEVNNKIIKISDNHLTSFGEYGNSDGQFTEIKFFEVLSNNELLVIDSLNRLQFFDTNFNHLKTIQYVSNNTQLSLIGNIKTLCSDIYANVYILDDFNNRIIKANSQLSYAEIYKSNIDSSIIFINLNTNGELILANQNTIFYNDSNLTIEEEISKIYIDASNFIFIKTPQTLYKYSINLVLEKSIQLPDFCTYLSINLENGLFYYLNSESSEILKIENFATDVSNFTPPINISDKTCSIEKTKFATIIKDCYLYSTPYQISSNINLVKNSEIIVLSENFNENLHYSYVLLENNSQILVGYIKSDCYSISTDKEYSKPAHPIRNDIPYYNLPLKKYNQESLKINTLNFEQTYQTTQKITFNNIEFYEIKIDEIFVFVECKNMLEDTSSYINVYFEPDSIVKTISDEKSVEIYSDLEKNNVIYLVEKPLNVKTIKKVGTLYEIQFLIDNEIKTGYVESSNVFNNKNDFIIPLVIVLIFICLIIILIILFKFKKEFKRNI